MIILLIFFAVAIIGIPLLVYCLQFKNLPKQVEQVEVINKNKKSNDIEGGPSICHHFITFKFPDNSEKEFFVPPDSEEGEHFPKNLYYSVQETDKGILTYKERAHAIKRVKNEKWHYNSRQFISFKKDSDFDKR